MNNRLQNYITLHDALHGFRQWRGVWTSNVEENMAQQLAGLAHEPLFQVFIDIQKSYNFLDRGIRMEILREYGLGPNIQRLLQW